MDIQLIRFKNKHFKPIDLKEDARFIEELNDTLFDNDCVLVDESKDPLFTIMFVESDNIEEEFSKHYFALYNPLIILVGKHVTALKGALELNSYLLLHDYDPLIVNGREASLIVEISKVIALKKQMIGSKLGAIGLFKNDERNNVKDLENKFGLTVQRFSKKRFVEAYLASEPLDIPHMDTFNKLISDKEELDNIKKLYHAINCFLLTYDLKGAAFNIPEYNRHASLLASIFNEKGYSFIVENDLTSLLSVYALNSISETGAMYASLSNIDFSHNKLTLLVKNLPFNLLQNELGLKKEEVTMCKISLNHRHIYSFSGKITDSRQLDHHSLLVDVEVEGREMFALFNEPLGGTLALTYGDYLGNLLAFDNIISLNERKD